MTVDTQKHCEFAMLAYQVLVVEKLVSLEEAADKLGLTYATLHGRLTSRTRFRADEIRRLIAIIPDQRLIQFFTEESGFVLARKPDALLDEASSIRQAVAQSVREAIDVMQVVVASLEAGTFLDHRDRAAILKEVREAEGAIATVRVAVEKQPPLRG
ncbi:hypothetical protein HZF05_16230 [Sphingomonas sp. CGMCC 1.13654]|uniref:Uncharacterized protein n=1 Tax=Sphingomonas chungangi TaxID=2683589 RepID=A0A838L830_9SPHN|nr:phage regulatory CII family protein [Sphingomonas chungangi]MBA2935633.1 hypothetical protein [Sphingomonas chungangi]MVW54324.1 hypothetical protein [Sphingomonas chungangi]